MTTVATPRGETPWNAVLHQGRCRLEVTRPERPQRPVAGTVPFLALYSPDDPDAVTLVFGRASRARLRKVPRELLDLGRVEPVTGAGVDVMPVLNERVEVTIQHPDRPAEVLTFARGDVDTVLAVTEQLHQDAIDLALTQLLAEYGGQS